MKQACTEYLKKTHVPHNNTPDAFNLDKYIEKDQTIEKRKASAWGNGDFKSLIKINKSKYYESEDAND